MTTYEFRADGHDLIEHVEVDESTAYIPAWASPFRCEMLFEFRDLENLVDTLLRMCGKCLNEFQFYVGLMRGNLTMPIVYHRDGPFWDVRCE